MVDNFDTGPSTMPRTPDQEEFRGRGEGWCQGKGKADSRGGR